MVFERLARFKVTFTTLSMDVLATEKCFTEVATTVNFANLNASYKVNILWPKNVFPET